MWGGAIEIRGEARALRDLLMRYVEEMEKLHEKVPPGKPAEGLTPAQRADLDRAATRAEQAAEQAGSLLTRAARFAAEKDKQAADANAAALAKEKQSEAMRDKAAALPMGTPEKSNLNAQANGLKAEADDLRAVSEKAKAEAEALRKGIAAAGGQTLPEELRAAADAIRNNRQGEGTNLQRSAAARLDKLVDALNEKQPDTAPNLKKWKKSADELNNLADAQDDLRKRAAEAAKIGDPAKRDAELKKLAPEQERLIERGKELFQRLTRERADSAARETRAAVERMETARDDLEQGNPASALRMTRSRNSTTPATNSTPRPPIPASSCRTRSAARWPTRSRRCSNGSWPRSPRPNGFTSSSLQTRSGIVRCSPVMANSRNGGSGPSPST